MATLKLADKNIRCCLLIFSGVEDPCWQLADNTLIAEINAVLQEQKPEDLVLRDNIVGYKGFRIESGHTIVRVFNGVIEVNYALNAYAYFKDGQRYFEKKLIRTIPEQYKDMLDWIVIT